MNKNEESKEKDQTLLSVRIISLGEVVWEGYAQSISAENTSGPFDVLPQHANFITILKDTPIVVKTESKEEKKFTFPRSLLYAKENEIKIYANV
ncbi:MAG: hypothetical protein ACQEP6_00215 [Patescibacteria group bacterium]